MSEKNLVVKIIIATHKKYRMPSDNMYIPLHVGAEGKKDKQGNILELGYKKDNTGDNISVKNSSFCELTGLYWAWKNLDADYIGLVHYRRHFLGRKLGKDKFDNILRSEKVKKLVENYYVIVPKRRKYYIESLYSHYKHTHYGEHLDLTREIISDLYPEYISCYDRVIKQRSGYMFNMMIMERELLDKYCKWLFDILFELERRINMPELSSFQGRFYGRVSEIIFNVWLEYQIENKYLMKQDIKELPYQHMERINWWKKGTSFLKAKFMNQKYEGSF